MNRRVLAVVVGCLLPFGALAQGKLPICTRYDRWSTAQGSTEALRALRDLIAVADCRAPGGMAACEAVYRQAVVADDHVSRVFEDCVDSRRNCVKGSMQEVLRVAATVTEIGRGLEGRGYPNAASLVNTFFDMYSWAGTPHCPGVGKPPPPVPVKVAAATGSVGGVPAPPPGPPPPPPAPAVPNIAGSWRGKQGASATVQQNGDKITFTASGMYGKRRWIVNGTGTINGRVILAHIEDTPQSQFYPRSLDVQGRIMAGENELQWGAMELSWKREASGAERCEWKAGGTMFPSYCECTTATGSKHQADRKHCGR